MKKTKSAVSLFLVLAMVASMCAFSFSVSAESSGIKVLESDYKIADKLSELDIIDVVEDEALADYVKRADMIPVLMKYLRLEGTEMSGNGSPFLDVDYNDESVGSYRALYWAGYISGDENKMYRPNDLLTYSEAVTFIINAMGYRPFAQRNGGYPAGYLYTANKYGLLEGVRGSGNNPIPFCDLYRIIEASVLADAVTYRYGVDEDSTSFSLNPDLSILEELYGYVFINGVVTGNENTRLFESSSSKIDRYQVEINNTTVYDTPGKEYGDYLGKRVYAYAKKADFGRYNIIYIEPVESVNKEFKISADDILKDKTTQTRIYYEDENYKEKHINVSNSGLAVVYNGKSITSSGYGQLKSVMPDTGYILGIDNTGDDVIDVLFIYELENIVVGAIDTINKKIYDKHITSKNIVLDSDKDEIRIYDASGASMKFEDIIVGDVLSVMESSNTSGYKLKIVYNERKTVEGTITEIIGNKYKIGDELYEKADNLITYNNAPYNTKLLSMGLSATFFLDHEGKIAYYESSKTTTLTYGFVGGVQEYPGLEQRLAVKIYNQSGNWVEADLTQRVRIDEVNYDLSKTSDYNTAKGIVERARGEVVLYNFNGVAVNKIDTRYGAGDLTVISEGAELYARSGIATSKTNITEGKFITPASTVVFKVPDISNPATILDDLEAFKVQKGLGSTINLYQSAAPTQTYMEQIGGYVAYNLGTTGAVNASTCVLFTGCAALYEPPQVGSAARTGISVFVKANPAVNKEGETRQKIYVLEDGKEQAYMSQEDLNASIGSLSLTAGDVIQYALDIDGNMSAIRVIYSTSNPERADAYVNTDEGGLKYDHNDGSLGMGKIVAVDSATKTLVINAKELSRYHDVGEIFINVSGAKISLYDKTAKELTNVTIDSLLKDDILIIRSINYATAPSQIIAIR